MTKLSYLEKQNQLLKFFADASAEVRYEKLIELGKQLPRLSAEQKVASNLVQGCQSIMYLHSYIDNGSLFFAADSDALISYGLAALLIKVYSGETAEVILTCPPDYIETIGISGSLTPSQANGLYSIHLRMKQEALKFLVKNEKGTAKL